MTTTEIRSSPMRLVALLAGPASLIAMALLAPDTLPVEDQRLLGVLLWMAVWWLSEVVPLAITSLLPIALFPSLGIASTREAAAPYASELVFLFLAGFLFAAALERWNAHRRVALAVVLRMGNSARGAILGMMVATAAVSLFISNTATAAMMYPIALAVGGMFGQGRDADHLRTALMLGIAYAASIGGMGTLIGTPPNLLLAATAERLLGQEISFTDFLLIGLPITAVLLPLCWALLVYVCYPGVVTLGADVHRWLLEQREALGPIASGEARTLALFAFVAVSWLLREPKEIGAIRVPGLTDALPGLTDGSVGVACAILLFVVSGRSRSEVPRPLLTWPEAVRIPWGVLLLFGGGLSLAAALEASTLTARADVVLRGLVGFSPWIVLLVVAMTVLVLSELASNTAVAAMALPLAASLAPAVSQPPLLMMLVVAFAASTGFALPIATPPNAIVFGSGQVSTRQMLKAGIPLDVVAVVVIVALVSWLAPR